MLAIVRLALKRPYTFVVMAILIGIFGVLSALRTPTDIFPNIGIPVISVVWSYNGLPPDEMSGRVIFPYERSLTTTVNDIDHIESQSLAGYGIVKIFFQPSVNINAAQAQVTAISQTVLKSLPAGITPPSVITYSASSVPIIQIALSSNTLSGTRLNDLAGNFIRPQLTSVPGAALPAAYGGAVRQIQVDLDQSALHSYGLSAQDVVTALTSQNLITPVGTQKIGWFEYTVNLNNSPKQIEEFNNLPIKNADGTVIYMRDVAHVHDGSPPQTNIVQMDGQKAVLMTVLKAGSASTLDIISGIKKLLPGIRDSLPPGIQVTPVGDQSDFVKSAVSGVVREGVIAAALTGLMILLFLGSWRSTLIITVSIPLAILASLTMLSILGETINVMTLGGLALAVGILVDDATVTIENINWHLEHGKPIETAILDGAKQIVVPATVSLMCICIAFVPMFGLSGVGGFLFRPLAEAVVFAMIASYVLSRTLVPTMANFLLRNQVHAHHDGHAAAHEAHGDEAASPRRSRNPLVRFQQRFEHVFEIVRSNYVAMLRLCLERRVAVITLFLLFPVVSFGLFPFLGQNFFPDIDAGAIKLHVRAQTGTRIEEVNRTVNDVETAVREIIPPDRLVGIVDNIGMPTSGLNIAYGNSGTIGVGDADILISLKEGEVSTGEYVRTMREVLPTKFPGTTFAFLPADIVSQILNFGAPAPLDVQIVGNDLNANRDYATKLIAKIRRVPGVADARVQQAFRAPALGVDVDRSLASMVGLTEKDATTSIQNSLAGSAQSSPTFYLDPRNGVSYPIAVQTPQYRMDTLNNLRNLPIVSNDASQVLGGVATIDLQPASAVISHYNVRPVIDIFATVQGRDLGAIAGEIQVLVDETKGEVPKGSRVELHGQVSIMHTAYNELFFGLAFAIVLIYLLIVITFQSWLDPFLIVLGLPTALAGIVWILFLTGTTLSVPALTGAIMCMGVATANSILIISFARERLEAGADAMSAAIEAGVVRFRPVMMTALAMIIGMAPMAIEHDSNSPLGRAVIGGLLFATFATLFFVPTLFSLSHRNAHRVSHNPSHAAPRAPAHT